MAKMKSNPAKGMETKKEEKMEMAATKMAKGGSMPKMAKGGKTPKMAKGGKTC